MTAPTRQWRSDKALFRRGHERRRASLSHGPVSVGHIVNAEALGLGTTDCRPCCEP
jgi:hypothetical protein